MCSSPHPTRLQALSQQLQDCQAETRELAGEALGAVRTVRSLHAERQELRRYEEALEKMLRIKTRKGVYSAVHLLLRRVRHFASNHRPTQEQKYPSAVLCCYVTYQRKAQKIVLF